MELYRQLRRNVLERKGSRKLTNKLWRSALIFIVLTVLSGNLVLLPVVTWVGAAEGDGSETGSGGDEAADSSDGPAEEGPGDTGGIDAGGFSDADNDPGRDSDAEYYDMLRDNYAGGVENEGKGSPEISPVTIAATPYGQLDGLGGQKKPEAALHMLDKILPIVQQAGTHEPEEDNGEEFFLMPSPLPNYAIGDAFIYSDGSWERVNDIAQDSVTWLNYRGNYSVGSPDFTFKRSRWETSSSKGTRIFSPTRFLFEEPSSSLWPLGLGNKARFDEKGSWVDSDGMERTYESYWRCDVEGASRINVIAGNFDTWRVRCARYPDSHSYPRAGAREYRIWYYAPEIEHWVLEIREKPGMSQEKRRELVAVVPDLSILTGEQVDSHDVQEQFQEVLEKAQQGEKDLWMAASGRIAISMTAGARYLADEVSCRRYEQRVQAGELSKAYPGVACRNEEGGWQIPRL